ncbi:hypothetical protein AB3R30_10695 [Leptolyngbyaceae cyanobacterium UHCC 1019]
MNKSIKIPNWTSNNFSKLLHSSRLSNVSQSNYLLLCTLSKPSNLQRSRFEMVCFEWCDRSVDLAQTIKS